MCNKFLLTFIVFGLSLSNSIFGANADLRYKIDEANRKITEAKSFILNAPRKIRDIEQESIKILDEKLELEARSARNKEESKSLSAQNSQIVAEIEKSIIPESNEVAKDLAEESYNLSNLQTVNSRLNDFSLSILQTQSRTNQLNEKYSKLINYQKQWLQKFDVYMTNTEPNFDSIVDLDSYNSIIIEINNLANQAPSSANLISYEAGLRAEATRYLRDIESHLQDLRQFAGYIEVATLRRLSNDRVIDSIGEMENELRRLFQQVSRIQQSTYATANQRNRLRLGIHQLWLKFAMIKLNLLNLGAAAELIAEIEKILASPNIYASIRSKNDFYLDQMRELIGGSYPFRADAMVAEAAKYAELLMRELEGLNLATSYHAEISTLIIDLERSVENYKTQSEIMISESSKYLQNWQRKTKIRMKRLGESAPTKCEDLSKLIQAADVASYEVESYYIEFRNEC